MFFKNSKYYSIFGAKQPESTGKVIIASILTATLGGIAGFLSHKENRDKTIEKINKLSNKLQEAGQNSLKEGEKISKNIGDKVTEVVSDLKDKINDTETVKSVEVKEVQKHHKENSEIKKEDK
jgi:hypothetical protein